MASLYLGQIGGKAIYEIHAITKNLPFRECPASTIADESLFRKIQEERYRLLVNGKAIYCTAVNPDMGQKIETSPHDERSGTVHFAAVDSKGNIACALSVAVDTGEHDNDDMIGLPLENRWQSNGFPVGNSLDRFRHQYLRLNYNRTRSVAPWEMAELYRHFRGAQQGNDLAPRIGIYTGCYHLLVREAIKRQITPTWLWVFDAIPSYFDLYRWVGLVVLRDMTVEDRPRWLSPPSTAMKRTKTGALQYHGEDVSRSIQVPMPRKGNSLTVELADVHFLDGVIDMSRIESRIFQSPVSLSPVKLKGFGLRDTFKMRVGLAITGLRCFQDSHPANSISNMINQWSLKRICPLGWDFNYIGDLQGGARSRHPFEYTI